MLSVIQRGAVEIHCLYHWELWYIRFLPGWSGQKSSLRGMVKYKLPQKIRKHYCPNIQLWQKVLSRNFQKNTYKLWLSFNSFIRILPWPPTILLSCLFWTSFYFLLLLKNFFFSDWPHWSESFMKPHWSSMLWRFGDIVPRLICTLIRKSQAPCKIYPIFFRVAKAPEIF